MFLPRCTPFGLPGGLPGPMTVAGTAMGGMAVLVTTGALALRLVRRRRLTALACLVVGRILVGEGA